MSRVIVLFSVVLRFFCICIFFYYYFIDPHCARYNVRRCSKTFGKINSRGNEKSSQTRVRRLFCHIITTTTRTSLYDYFLTILCIAIARLRSVFCDIFSYDIARKVFLPYLWPKITISLS